MSRLPLFSLGQVLVTPGALSALETAGENANDFLARHQRGDWGNLCSEDRKANERCLVQGIIQGLGIQSSYTLRTGVELWIITEADRSATTILLPSEN